MDPAPPSGRLAEDQRASVDRDCCCVICLDDVVEPCQLCPCGHRNFHFSCIHTWLLGCAGRACPVCKAPVARADHGRQKYVYDSHDPIRATAARPHVDPPLRVLALAEVHHDASPPRRRPSRAAATEPAGLAFRRIVYRRLLYSMHIGSNPVSRYRELTRDAFRHDQELLRRTRAFLRRELRVFGWLATPDGRHETMPLARSFQDRRRATTCEKLLGHIVRLLQSFELRGSDGCVEDDLTTHLGRQNTRLPFA